MKEDCTCAHLNKVLHTIVGEYIDGDTFTTLTVPNAHSINKDSPKIGKLKNHYLVINSCLLHKARVGQVTREDIELWLDEYKEKCS